MSSRKSVGHSKKYAQTMKSFDRSVTRTTNAVSRVAFGQAKRGRSRQNIDTTSDSWERTSLTNKQLIASCVVGAIPSNYVSSWKGRGNRNNRNNRNASAGLVLLLYDSVLCNGFDFYGVQYHYSSEIEMQCKAKQSCMTEENVNEVNEPAQLYSPNPEWMGQTGLVDSRANARVLAPQFLKQAQESAKTLQTTTDPATFFTRYDFCVGRLIELEKCKKYGAPVSATADLKKYRSLSFRDDAVKEIIHRTEEKYQAKIEGLKTAKAKQNWAEKYHQAFEPYLPYMTDDQKSELGEASAYLFDLAQK